MKKLLISKLVLLLSMLCLTACDKKLVDTEETIIEDITEAITEDIKTQEEEFFEVSDIHSTDQDFHFAINYQIKKWQMDTFEGQVKEASDIIRQQYIDYDPISSTMPSWWHREFNTSKKLLDYLGCDMLIIPSWDIEETKSFLTVNGDEEGNFENLYVEVDYITDNIRMQLICHIFTEFSDQDSLLYGVGQQETYIQEEGLTPGGYDYAVITSGENPYGYICKDGFLIRNGVLYNFHLAYTATYEQEAKDLLEQWLAGF